MSTCPVTYNLPRINFYFFPLFFVFANIKWLKAKVRDIAYHSIRSTSCMLTEAAEPLKCENSSVCLLSPVGLTQIKYAQTQIRSAAFSLAVLIYPRYIDVCTLGTLILLTVTALLMYFTVALLPLTDNQVSQTSHVILLLNYQEDYYI